MELVKFTVNNWAPGKDYPATPTFISWMRDLSLQFLDNDWCVENKLAVVTQRVDMSRDFTVIAPKDWVKKNYPEILGSKFEMPIDRYGNCFGTPFIDADEYESHIGLYWYAEDEYVAGWEGLISNAEWEAL